MKTFEHAFNKALKTKSGRSTYALAALSYNTIISLIKQNQEIPKNLINNISIWPNWTSALVITLIKQCMM